MPIYEFPPVDTADEHGLLALGGDLETESLLLAYQQGIFPWPISDEYPLAWFSPDPRGILFFQDFKIPQSFKKTLKNSQLEITFNKDFKAVIQACSNVSNRKGTDGTWITEEIIEAYLKFHEEGYAYSVEAWDQNYELVGGLYGVNIGTFVSGESMFYRQSNASKIVLYYLMHHLHDHGIEWLDTQMVTSVVKSFGGKEISRPHYLDLLNENLAERKPEKLFL